MAKRRSGNGRQRPGLRERGATDVARRPTTTVEMLTTVDERFAQIRKQLDVQVTRSAQLQIEIDRQRRDTEVIQERLAEIQAVLKKLLKSSSA